MIFTLEIIMLKSYDIISRFMDGPAVNVGMKYMYIRDRKDNELIVDTPDIRTLTFPPILKLHDINTGKQHYFSGDCIKKSWDSIGFRWFSSIEEIGVLYWSHDNPLQRAHDIKTYFPKFIERELFFETVRALRMPIGEVAKEVLERKLEFSSQIYAHTISLMYAAAARNKDVLELNPEYGIKGLAEIKIANDLEDFINLNPQLKESFNGMEFSKNGVSYDNPKAIIEKIQKDIPDETLEAMHKQFLSEIEGGKKLDELRAKYPLKQLEEQEADIKKANVKNL